MGEEVNIERIDEIIKSNVTITDSHLLDAVRVSIIDAVHETYIRCADICREEVPSLDGQLCAEAILRDMGYEED